MSAMAPKFDPAMAMFALVVLVLALLVVLPLGWLGWYSITDKTGALTLGNFAQLVTDPTMRKPALVTLEIALGSSLIACGVAIPLAWLISRTDMMARGVIRALVTASFVTPPFLGAVAWELLAAPNSGLLNQWLRPILGLDDYDYVFDIYTEWGVIFCIACYTFPYVFTVLANALDNMPGELDDASHILGGGSFVTLRRITLPLVLPSILAGTLVAFLQAMTIFGTPAILALPSGFHTLTTKIWKNSASVIVSRSTTSGRIEPKKTMTFGLPTVKLRELTNSCHPVRLSLAPMTRAPSVCARHIDMAMYIK